MTDHLNIVLTRTDADSNVTRTTYDSNFAEPAQIATALLRELGSEPTCPVPELPEGYRCDGCDCERATTAAETGSVGMSEANAPNQPGETSRG